MRQVLQDLRSGRVEVADVPAPEVRPAHLLVRTTATLISPGTERMLLEFGRAGLLGKARSQPERVRQAVAKVRTDGIGPTLEAVTSRLGEPVALGYCSVGRVLEVGAGVRGFAPGQRVVSNGPHAEIACVPAALAAAVPDPVDDESAAFTVLGAIALNGTRLLEPTFGETFAVVGLGLLGLLSVQLLRASGCRVVAIDVDRARCDAARALGAEVVCAAGDADPVRAAHDASAGRGVDGVLIAAAARGDEIVAQAARMCRKRGRVVLVGVVGLRLERSAFYEKELSFRVACSYGPGRYDPEYEVAGRDYPLAFVRWTAARNFEAVLGAIAAGRLAVRDLVSRRFAIDDAAAAYAAVLDDRSALGIVLDFPEANGALARTTAVAAPERPRLLRGLRASPASGGPVVGVIGAGQFARQVLLPALCAAGARIDAVASAGGVSSLVAARRFGAREATTDVTRILASPSIDTVVVATRHDSHAALAAAALRAGKHVFVEKPLALDEEGLEEVEAAHAEAGDRQLVVGFNRRFAPLALECRRLLAGRTEPIALVVTVNAGAVPAGHWTLDPRQGGGRIAGEACHFVDLALFLVDRPIAQVRALPLGGGAASAGGAAPQSAAIEMAFADGSLATIHYLACGPLSFPKERIEVFSEGRALVVDNWRRLRPFGWPGARRRWMRQDKGHGALVAELVRRVRAGGAPLVPFTDVVAVTRATLVAARDVGTADFARARGAREAGARAPEAMAKLAGDAPAASSGAIAGGTPLAALGGAR